MIDKLSEYGHDFQTKVIVSLLGDKILLEQIFDILNPKYFENDAQSWFISEIRDHYRKYKDVFTLTAMKTKIAGIENKVLKEVIKEEIGEIKKHFNDTDLNFVKNEFLEFCKFQNVKDAIIKSADLIKLGEYEAIRKIINLSVDSGNKKTEGHNYKLDVDKRLHGEARTPISTGMQVLDEIMDGGLSYGELFVVAAPPGIGKSWVLSSIGLNIIKSGKNVLHITLELNEAYTGIRYDVQLINIPSSNIKFHEEELINAINKYVTGELFIEYFPTKSITVETLKAVLNKYNIKGIHFDALIVDYADILKTNQKTSVGNSYYDVGAIYEDLRGLAGEYKIPVFTASQINKSGADNDVIEGDKLAESYKKLMTADFLVTVSRQVEDKYMNTARWHIVKNRFGVDGMTFPSKMNTTIGKIELFPPESRVGKDLNKNMKEDNNTKKLLASKYKELNDTKKIEGFE